MGDTKSKRSAFNSHRPSTSGRVNSRRSQRGGDLIDNKQLDIDNYLDHKIMDFAKNQNQSAAEFLSVN